MVKSKIGFHVSGVVPGVTECGLQQERNEKCPQAALAEFPSAAKLDESTAYDEIASGWGEEHNRCPVIGLHDFV